MKSDNAYKALKPSEVKARPPRLFYDDGEKRYFVKVKGKRVYFKQCDPKKIMKQVLTKIKIKAARKRKARKANKDKKKAEIPPATTAGTTIFGQPENPDISYGLMQPSEQRKVLELVRIKQAQNSLEEEKRNERQQGFLEGKKLRTTAKKELELIKEEQKAKREKVEQQAEAEVLTGDTETVPNTPQEEEKPAGEDGAEGGSDGNAGAAAADADAGNAPVSQRAAHMMRNVLRLPGINVLNPDMPALEDDDYDLSKTPVDRSQKANGRLSEQVRDIGLYSDQIAKMMKGYKGFLGVVAADEVHYLAKKSLNHDKFGFVMNKDPASSPGSHWVAVFIDTVDDKAVEYFDSFAEEPDDLLLSELKKFMQIHKLDIYLKFKVNRVKSQAENSSLCGFHAMKFLMDRFAGKPFVDASGWSDVRKREHEAKELMQKFDRFDYI